MRYQITPRRGLFDIDITGLWHYRDLYIMYIKREIVTQYKQTILGPFWYVIQPIVTTLVYMFVFGGLAGIGTEGTPQPLFYLAGILLWGYFGHCFAACSDVFIVNAEVFGKVYFPRLVVPFALCTAGLLRLLIHLVLFAIVYFYYFFFSPFASGLSINNTLFLFPFLIVLIGLLGMSWGLIVSSMSAKYRDLKVLSNFAISFLLYITPVFYPLSSVPTQFLPIIRINPLTYICEAFKFSCLGCGQLSVEGLFYSFFFVVFSFVISLIVFSRTERTFIDNI